MDEPSPLEVCRAAATGLNPASLWVLKLALNGFSPITAHKSPTGSTLVVATMANTAGLERRGLIVKDRATIYRATPLGRRVYDLYMEVLRG